MEITVIGANGFVGSAVAQTLQEISDSRLNTPSKIQLNLNDSRTYSIILDSTVIICCAETSIESKIEFFEFCLEHGLIIIESSADPEIIEALSKHFKRKKMTKGALILGMGIFPGLSNLLVKKVTKHYPQAKDISIFISMSPFSGAGLTTIKLMVDALARPPIQIINGKGKVLDGSLMRFPVWLPESQMLAGSLCLGTVKTYLQPRPGILIPVLSVFKKLGLFRSKFVQKIFRTIFGFLRGTLFSKVPTNISIEVIDNETNKSLGQLVASDGLLLGSQIIAASTIALNGMQKTGVFYPDEMFEIDDFLTMSKKFGFVDWKLTKVISF